MHDVSEGLVAMFAIFSIFIAFPWMILHFISRTRDSRAKAVGDPAMSASLSGIADRLEQRLDSIETLLDHEVPGWRKPQERRNV